MNRNRFKIRARYAAVVAYLATIALLVYLLYQAYGQVTGQ